MSEASAPKTPVLLVGVQPEQASTVALAAAKLATQLGASVLCVHVQSGRLVTTRLPQTLPDAQTSAPDESEDAATVFPAELHQHLSSVFDQASVSWSARELEGDPAKALSLVAEDVDAVMIVVGTRRQGLRSKMAEFIDGSVAVNLAHRQARPVLVIPQRPNLSGNFDWSD